MITAEELRGLILLAEPDIVEEAKWRKASNPDGVPTSRRPDPPKPPPDDLGI